MLIRTCWTERTLAFAIVLADGSVELGGIAEGVVGLEKGEEGQCWIEVI
jgi:hypothetical protein